MTPRVALICAVFVAAVIGWWLWNHPRGGVPAERVVWSRDPVQEEPELEPFELTTREGPVKVIPRARYDLNGVLVSHRKNLDAFSYLIPIDACIVWGLYGDEKERTDLSVSNHGRVCYVQYRSGIDGTYLMTHLSNNHLVPANENVRRAIFWMGDGDEVRLQGQLVDLEVPVPHDHLSDLLNQLGKGDLGNAEQHGDTFVWKTSLTRDDTGMGACETMWVTSVQIGKKLYQ